MLDICIKVLYNCIIDGEILMKFTKYAELDMSSLQGYVNTTYAKLIDVFGEPNRYSDGKVTCEWNIKFADGTIASIYDYKEDETPLDQYNWHVGGFNADAVKRVSETLQG
jgi:hypothetical protein